MNDPALVRTASHWLRVGPRLLAAAKVLLADITPKRHYIPLQIHEDELRAAVDNAERTEQ